MYIGWLNIGCVFAHLFWVAVSLCSLSVVWLIASCGLSITSRCLLSLCLLRCVTDRRFWLARHIRVACVTDRRFWLARHFRVVCVPVGVMLCDWSPILACASHQSGLCACGCYVVWLIADSGLRVTSEWSVCRSVLCCVTDHGCGLSITSEWTVCRWIYVVWLSADCVLGVTSWWTMDRSLYVVAETLIDSYMKIYETVVKVIAV